VADRLAARVEQTRPGAAELSGICSKSATDYLRESVGPMNERYMTARAVRDLAARLSERDYAVLSRVSALRFVSGDQLRRLCFADEHDQAASARTARRTLLRLVRLDVLARLPRPIGGVRSGSAGFVYHLGLGGLRLAIERDWQPERRRRRSIVPGTLFVRHALAVAELHTEIVEADRSRRFELLELAAEPTCWRTFGVAGGQRAVLKPDSYVRLGLGSYEDSYFIEVDRATEGSRALERQLQLYGTYHASGTEQTTRGVFPSTLWVAPTAERREAIEDCIRRRPVGEQALFRVATFADALAVLEHLDE
jgi:hypothetical protein